MKLNRLIISLLVCGATLGMAAQENVELPVKPGTSTSTPPTLQPSTPTWSTPSMTPGYSQPEIPSLDLTPRDLADSIAAFNSENASGYAQPGATRYNFEMDPYSRNYSRSGMMAIGSGFLMGSSSYSAMPALGNIGTATLQWVQPLGERLIVGAGASGTKYHFDNRAWNDYSVFANARYTLSDHFAIKAWGSYSFAPLYHSMAAMPYVGTSNYGASLDMKLNGTLGLELGAQRYYDPLSGRWNTVPVIAPTINILGAPISIDLGGLVKNWLDKSNRKNNFFEPVDPMKPVDMKVAAPPGFNPHSPVRIPDALR